MKTEDLWIFAYGSLCWQPGFEYEEMVVGHIKGWIRRFWQGNQVHRGTAEKPGRVATLVPDQDGETYGCAYRVNPIAYQRTLKYLDNRETKLGGYDSKRSLFYPCDSETEPFMAILYIALPGNVDWRGPGELEDIADEVITASGVCGSNIAYVTDLAAFLRTHEFKDDHVFELEAIVLEKLRLEDSNSSVSAISEDEEEEGSDSLESSIE